MNRTVIWLNEASQDLIDLYDWIAETSDPSVAFSYTSRVENHAETLSNFAERRTPRDELKPGLRSLTYRRRTIIFYQIVGRRIEIVKLAHGGRDLPTLFGARLNDD